MTLKQAALRIQKELSEHGFHMSAHAGKIAAALAFIERGEHGPDCKVNNDIAETFERCHCARRAARDGVPE